MMHWTNVFSLLLAFCLTATALPAPGKTVSTIELQSDDVEDSNKLNYCMVDDITVESKSLF